MDLLVTCVSIFAFVLKACIMQQIFFVQSISRNWPTLLNFSCAKNCNTNLNGHWPINFKILLITLLLSANKKNVLVRVKNK